MSSGCWDKNFKEGVKSAWAQNRFVQEAINLRMTGQPKHWLSWIFEDYLKKSKPNTLLSVGCGDGAHELIIARMGYVEQIDAFDASQHGIAKAKETAKSERLNVNFYHDTFENYALSASTEKYDAIMFSGSLHHVKDLEGVLERTKRDLAKDGKFIFNEYVGACYNIYPSQQVHLINSVIQQVPPAFKLSPAARWVNPSIEAVMAVDPSESVRSSLLLQFMQFYFDFEFVNYFGGGLLHPIFDLLNGAKINDGSVESECLVRMLIWLDDFLYSHKIIPSDFAFGVGKHKE